MSLYCVAGHDFKALQLVCNNIYRQHMSRVRFLQFILRLQILGRFQASDTFRFFQMIF